MNPVNTNLLPDNTRAIFENLSKQSFISRYSLVGGTALTLQIGHRLSEDLDFIYDGEKIDTNSINRNLARLYPSFEVIRIDRNEQIDMVINDSKITFFSSGSIALPFSVKEHTYIYNKMNICSAKIIASLKLAAIAQRNTIRDYYDLYYLVRYHFSLLDIIRQTRDLIPNLSPVTYTETLVYTSDIDENDISSHLQPKEKITIQEIAEFFAKELKLIIEKI